MRWFNWFNNDKKKRTGNKLNMIIARTNQISTRVIGMQLTAGTAIGILLSMTQMSLGFLFVTSGITKGTNYMVAMVVVIGCLLAILVERLSIGGLAAVREGLARKKKYLDGYYKMFARRDPTQRQLEDKKRKESEFKKDIVFGWVFGGLGMTISIVLGDLFWHSLFKGLGDPWPSIPLSGMCAAVITLTFVHAELFQAMLVRTLKAIIRDNHLMKTAVNVEPENMQLDILTNVMANARDDESILQPSEKTLGRALRKQLSNFSGSFTSVSELDDNAVEGSIGPVPTRLQIAAPRSRNAEYMRLRGQLKQYMADHPGVSAIQAAAEFGKPKSTIQRWMEKVSTEL